MSTTLIEQLNAIIETGEVSRAGLARAAGLHPNSLRKLGQPDWNPTADTLGRLEKLIQRGTTDVLVGTEAIINEARNGRMFILVDDESRENEGDLVIPAQMATPESINRVVTILNKYPDRFLFGTDTVAPQGPAPYFAVFDMWAPVWKQLTAAASLKVRRGNYERIFDEGRRRVRAWEKTNVQ